LSRRFSCHFFGSFFSYCSWCFICWCLLRRFFHVFSILFLTKRKEIATQNGGNILSKAPSLYQFDTGIQYLLPLSCDESVKVGLLRKERPKTKPTSSLLSGRTKKPTLRKRACVNMILPVGPNGRLGTRRGGLRPFGLPTRLPSH